MKSDHSELNQALETENQQHIRRLVKSLPEESLSLAWRSQLNERLLAVRPVPRWKARLSHTWKPALGLALAGCLALTVGLRSFVHPTSDRSGLEASLVNAYNDTSRVEDLVGAGLGAHEVGDTTRDTDASSHWTETDLNSL